MRVFDHGQVLRSRVRGVTLIVFAAVLQAGCEEGGGSAPTGDPVVRDSAGVAIVEHPTELPTRDTWTLSLDGAVRVDDELTSVRNAVRLADGRFVVADGDSRTIRFFDGEGAPLNRVGAQGGGPGEFREISYMSRWPGDSILTWDIPQRRLTLLAGDGSLVRSFAFATTTDVPFANVRGVFGDGSMLTAGFTAGGMPQPGRQYTESPAYHFLADGSLNATYPFTFAGESFFRIIENGFSVFSALFPRLTALSAGPTILVEADNQQFELRVRAPDGTLQRLIRRAGAPAPVTDDIRRAAIDHALAAIPENSRDTRRLVLEEMELPSQLPVFGRILVDLDDHIWVEAYAPVPPERSSWLVFATDGMLIARATMPQRFTPMEIGRDYVLGVHRDELDVEEVLSLRLTR